MKTIVAAVDFSNSTAGVLEAAVKIARAFGSSLHLLHVVEPEPSYTAYGFTPDEFPAIHLFQEEARKRATARLQEIRLAAGELNATVLLQQGEPAAAALIAEDLTTRSPLREAAWALLVRALYLAGRPAEALHRFETIRKLLAEELGAGPALRRVGSLVDRLELTGLAGKLEPLTPPG